MIHKGKNASSALLPLIQFNFITEKTLRPKTSLKVCVLSLSDRKGGDAF
jgi:hypothetical protein